MTQGSIYIHGLPCPLLVPRHSSEQARDNCTCTIFRNESCQLFLGQCKHCKTMWHNDATKTSTLTQLQDQLRTNLLLVSPRPMMLVFLTNMFSNLTDSTLTINSTRLDLIQQNLLLRRAYLKKNNWQFLDEQNVQEQEQFLQQDLLHFDVKVLCLFHPQGHHTWGECTFYTKYFGTPQPKQIGSITLSPQPLDIRNHSNWKHHLCWPG